MKFQINLRRFPSKRAVGIELCWGQKDFSADWWTYHLRFWGLGLWFYIGFIEFAIDAFNNSRLCRHGIKAKSCTCEAE